VSATRAALVAAASHLSAPLGVGIVGCGLIGRRRARTALLHERTELRALADRQLERAAAAAGSACDVCDDWQQIVRRADIDVVVVSTPNSLLVDVVTAALEAGKHVLMEKPMGRSLQEAERIRDAAARSGRVLHVGFNHRFHPGIRRAAEHVRSGALGALITVRARYGHGGRPGLEREWRSDPEQAGGGELMDQGVHLMDLLNWVAGMPQTAFGVLQTAVWPIDPLEDNAYALLHYENGAVAQLHVSMTQWKNLFSLEVHGERGSVVVEGLGGSYGPERFVRVERSFEGGAPVLHEEVFEGEDLSWAREWSAFVRRIDTGEGSDGLPDDGVAAMRLIDAVYRSAHSGASVAV
jgi:predicted dehydrogenase